METNLTHCYPEKTNSFPGGYQFASKSLDFLKIWGKLGKPKNFLGLFLNFVRWRNTSGGYLGKGSTKKEPFLVSCWEVSNQPASPTNQKMTCLLQLDEIFYLPHVSVFDHRTYNYGQPFWKQIGRPLLFDPPKSGTFPLLIRDLAHVAKKCIIPSLLHPKLLPDELRNTLILYHIQYLECQQLTHFNPKKLRLAVRGFQNPEKKQS